MKKSFVDFCFQGINCESPAPSNNWNPWLREGNPDRKSQGHPDECAENYSGVRSMYVYVYDVTKKLCNDRPRRMKMVKDQDGKLLTTEEEIRTRWQEHFSKVQNRPDPEIQIASSHRC